jgi:hypothetical protein
MAMQVGARQAATLIIKTKKKKKKKTHPHAKCGDGRK